MNGVVRVVARFGGVEIGMCSVSRLMFRSGGVELLTTTWFGLAIRRVIRR